MEIFTTKNATYGRGLRAALTRTAVTRPSAVPAPACPFSADLVQDKAHMVQGGRPPRGSEALL